MQPEAHTFLVTGGSSGLGAATARRLHSAGASVILGDVNDERGSALADELGERARFMHVDVTEAASIERALETARNDFSGLHGVINCAGIVLARRTLGKRGAHDLESFAKVVEINLVGTFNVVRLASVTLAENEPNEEGERGVIVNTASVAAFDGQIGQAAYAASKGGVVGMTLPLARDLARSGIRVMTIAPGIFDTPMMAGMPEEVRNSLAGQIPFPSRFGQPEEYAALAMHIINNPMLNGEVIRLDGAVRMGPS